MGETSNDEYHTGLVHCGTNLASPTKVQAQKQDQLYLATQHNLLQHHHPSYLLQHHLSQYQHSNLQNQNNFSKHTYLRQNENKPSINNSICLLESNGNPSNYTNFSNQKALIADVTQASFCVNGNTASAQNSTTDLSTIANVTSPSIVYTVHRVVTTAQIKACVGDSFARSPGISNIVSDQRNESGHLLNSSILDAGASMKEPCINSENDKHIPTVSTISVKNDFDNNIMNNGNNSSSMLGLKNRAGPCATLDFLVSQKNSNATSDSQHPADSPVSLEQSICPNGGRKSSIVTRPLQNVIPTCVYLMSRVAVHMEIEGTTHCPTQLILAAALGCEELGISNKLLAQSIFGLWMTSSLLEVQLKSHQSPYIVRVAWPNLLHKFCNGNPMEKKFDEPIIILKRNVFFSKRDEEKIKDHRILELLYEEAKHNVLTRRYIMDPKHALMLGGIQARIELGPYNSHTHTLGFFRENQSRFLPHNVAKNSSWSWLPVSPENSAEAKLLEQLKRVPQTATTRKLMRKYLEFCWELPFYGAAYFHGQMEQPVYGPMSFVNQKDIDVLVAVNERGVYIIDPSQNTILLGLKYQDLSWDFAKPSANENPECLHCIFLQFDVIENGIQISKLVQIFSSQAAMIDALIYYFTERINKKKMDGCSTDQLNDEPIPIQNNGTGAFSNKLSRLTMATFDEEGRCIGQMGSLSISY